MKTQIPYNVSALSPAPSLRRLLRSLSLMFSLLVALSSCSQANQVLKAGSAERAGFIPSVLDLKEERARSPFHGVWYKDEDMFYQRRAETTKLYLLPVRTDFLLEKGWWSELNSLDREEYEKDVKELAAHFDSELQNAFENHESNRWKIVTEPDEESLIIEYALVEVVATKVHINAIGTTLGFFVPGGGLISRAGGGSVAFEANIYDGKDGELLLSLADREADKLAVVTLKDYQFYAHARKTIMEWSEQFAELANTEKEITVEDSSAVTIEPW